MQLQREDSQKDIHDDKNDHFELRQQVATDLKEKLKDYSDPKKGIKIIASLMGIHEKTLKRLIECKNSPHYQTLFKIYRVLFSTSNDTELLKIIPPVVQVFLSKTNPRPMLPEINYSMDVERELLTDPIFCEIYAIASAGGISREYISFQYGKYGESILTKMLTQKVLTSYAKNFFTRGTNRPPYSSTVINHMGQLLVQNFFDPENGDQKGENCQTLYISNLNEDAYNEWLKIEERAFQDKIKISQDPKNEGDIKAFSFSTTDKLIRSNKNTKH